MITLAILTVWEIALVMLPETELPESAIAGVLTLLLWAVAVMGIVDVRSGFPGRLAYGFAIAWYIGSIGRWMVPLNDVYVEAGDAVGLVLSMAFLMLAPLAMLLTAGFGPAMNAVGKVRNRNGG